ncbi:uncharacterized protein LOC117643650 [Thrips palmi]|uniref:Uncharacterized protein LOC117643650 n=1 Tax=Thrips palmi TaxID=161013 RepID=A0A6P8YFN8_THRPL|nr:uncharacterized protein LOC117643650 [Thrips palmi]
MARLSALLFAAAVALALVCGTTSAPASEETAVLNHNIGFSIDGIAKCLAVLGLTGWAQSLSEILKDCVPLSGRPLRFQFCVLNKVTQLGPQFVECVRKTP